MKSLKRAVMVGLSLALVTTACADGGDTEGVDEPAAEESETESGAQEPTEAAGSEDETGGDLEALIAAAQEEGSLIWYTGSVEHSAVAMAEAFEAEYGIPVEFTRLTSAPIAQRVSAEVESGAVEVDVVSTVDDVFFLDAADNGWFVELTSDELPELESWPQDFVLGGDAAITFGVGPMSVGWNTDLLEGDPPCTWDALLDEQFAGEIILTDPSTSAAYTNYYNGILQDPNLGEQWLQDFAALGYATVAESATPAGQLLAAGEGTISLVSTNVTIEALQEEGAPVDHCVLENPSPVYEQYMAVTADAPHPNAARLFTNWFMTVEAQELYASEASLASPLPEVEGGVPLPEGLVSPNTPQAQENLEQIQQLLGL